MQKNSYSNHFETKRIDWIDYAKAIAAMLVICLHIPNYDVCKNVINSFVLPMFFILSGMTFSYKNERFKTYLKKKILTLVWASFALYGILNIVIEYVFSLISGNEFSVSIKSMATGVIFQMRGSYEFGAWFLICMFTSQIMIFFLAKYIIKKPIHILISAMLFYFIGNIYSLFIHKVLPWSLDVALLAVAYILFGYYIKEAKLFENIINTRIFLICVVLFLFGNIIAITSGNTMDLYLNNIGNPVAAILTAVGGTGIIFYICKKIRNNRVIKFIGQNSLIIYCTQYSFIRILNNFNMNCGLLFKFIIYFLITLVATTITSYVVRRFFPIMIGKIN